MDLKEQIEGLVKTYDDLGKRSGAIEEDIHRLINELQTALSEVKAIRRARLKQMEDFRETLRTVAPQFEKDLFP